MFSLSASKRVKEPLAELGQITLLAKEAASSLLKGRASWRDLLYQIYFIGVQSQSVVLNTGPSSLHIATLTTASVVVSILNL